MLKFNAERKRKKKAGLIFLIETTKIIIAAVQRWVGSGLFLANLGNSEQQTGE